MKFLLSLDYELFFGDDVGTVSGCMIEPTDAMLKVAEECGVKLTLFVDAPFLLRLREEAKRHHVLRADFDALRKQLSRAVAKGHDIQLHVHPHWLDSTYDGSGWRLSTSRFRLHDFEPADRCGIVSASQAILQEIVGRPVFAFRAGGWCLQPFSEIEQALSSSGLWLDSTVYPGGYSGDTGRHHDFRSSPAKSFWRFRDNPAEEASDGGFVEVPISSFRASPLLFWKMAYARRRAPETHKPFGEGRPIRHGSGYYCRRLLFPSISVASVDGLKAGTLQSALNQWRRRAGEDFFHAMGHPKSLTQYSLTCLRQFLGRNKQMEPVVLADYAYLKPESGA